MIEEAMGGVKASKLTRVDLPAGAENKLTWTELGDAAKAKGCRLPTAAEFSASGINNGHADTWMPVTREDGRTDDWIQIGNHGHNSG